MVENVQLTLHNNRMDIIDHINNQVPGGLKYYDDRLELYNTEASSVFSFKVSKIFDGKLHPRLSKLHEAMYISFRFNGKNYLHTITDFTEDDTTVSIVAESFNLKLLYQKVPKVENPGPLSLLEYINLTDLVSDNLFEIGKNDAAGYELDLSLSESTMVKRLLDLASAFDMEIDYRVEIFPNGNLDRVYIDFIKAYDEELDAYGKGRDRRDVQLTFGRDITGVTVKQDLKTIVNALILVDESGVPISATRSIKQYHSEDTSRIEYFVDRNSYIAYAPLSMLRYPSTLRRNSCDNWVVGQVTLPKEITDSDAILEFWMKELKKNAYPKTTYTVNMSGYRIVGDLDISIGDTIYVNDKNFIDGLLMRARVDKMTVSFTNPLNNKIELTNFKRIKSEISDSLIGRMSEMIKDSAPYVLTATIDGGVMFKNATGQTTIKPILTKNDMPLDNVLWLYYRGTELLGNGPQYTVFANEIQNDVEVIDVVAMINDQEVQRTQLTFANVMDGDGVPGPVGPAGPPGPPGADGPKGDTGKSLYTWVRYADDENGTNMSDNPTGKTFMGIATNKEVETPSDNPKDYTWSSLAGSNDYTGNLLAQSNILTTEQSEFMWTLAESIYPDREYTTTANFWGSDGSGVTGVELELTDGTKVPLLWNNKVGSWTATFKPTVEQGYPTVIKLKTIPEGTLGNINFITLVKGRNSMSAWQPHWTEIDGEIKNKADDTITKQALNDIAQRTELQQKELEARATIDELKNFIDRYEKFVTAEESSRQKSEEDFKMAASRIVQMENVIGVNRALWTAIDRSMSFQEEGLILSKDKTGTALKITDDRISMVSGGTEVMWITNGVIHIDNGVFTQTLQVGHYREEQYEHDSHINVIRYYEK